MKKKLKLIILYNGWSYRFVAYRKIDWWSKMYRTKMWAPEEFVFLSTLSVSIELWNVLPHNVNNQKIKLSWMRKNNMFSFHWLQLIGTSSDVNGSSDQVSALVVFRSQAMFVQIVLRVKRLWLWKKIQTDRHGIITIICQTVEPYKTKKIFFINLRTHSE